MGPLVNRPATTAVAAGIATLIVAVNIYLLWETFFGS
jgi:Mn2+/Fe2+ NRAMP family transporter